jgi:hypothetical protein
MMIENANWLVPQKVLTPNILSDIKKYCGVEITAEMFNALSPDIGKKLRTLAERLEFIEHLLVLRSFVYENSSQQRSVERIDDQKSLVKVEYSFILYGHDLAGANFDIEALIFYMLLTCVDTIKGQPDYEKPFDWLCQESNLETLANLDKELLIQRLKSLQENYSTSFSPTRLFIKAFTDDLSEELRDELLGSVMVVKVHDNKIVSDSLKAWHEREKKRKIKKLAEKFYEIRSLYTHSSIRTFWPVVPLGAVPSINGEQLLCKQGFNLLGTLNKIVVYLIKSQKII